MQADRSHIIKVPIEYYERAKKDPRTFWQSHGSYSLRSSSPYFESLDNIRATISPRKNPFNDKIMKFDDDFICEDDFIRFMHVDLGQKFDACGISMCCIKNWIEVEELKVIEDRSYTDRVFRPQFYFDFIGRIKAPKGGEIIFDDIRQLIYELNLKGFPIGLITYDRFGSIDSIQILRNEGYVVGNLSMDRTAKYALIDVDKDDNLSYKPTEGTFKHLTAWTTFKGAVNTGRVDLPTYLEVSSSEIFDFEDKVDNIDDFGNSLKTKKTITWVEQEMRGAIYDSTKGKEAKVHEPVGGSIDLLESIAGSVFNASNNVTEEVLEETSDQRRRRLVRDLSQAQTDQEKSDIKRMLNIEDDEDNYGEDFTDDSIFA